MEIVIDISDERFRDIQRIAEVQTERKHFKTAEQIIANGIPLPKGHGRIADIDKVLEEMKVTRTYDIPFILEKVKSIIPADTESEG